MAPKETGGVVMGYKLKETFYITDVVGPGEKAVHDYNSFSPDNNFHEKEIARIYKESGRIHTYLGDWHTHPCQRAYLSERDKKTLRNISAFKPSRLPEPLMIILGSNPFQIKAWLYSPKKIISFAHIHIALKW
jgi:integrative and conjugative element protein (TIGR02256 family)